MIDSLAPGGSYVIYPIGGTFEFVEPFLEGHFSYGMQFYANPQNRQRNEEIKGWQAAALDFMLYNIQTDL